MLCAPYSVWILQAGRIGPSGVCLVRPPWIGEAILETQGYTTHLLYIHPFLPCILKKDCCVHLEKSTNNLISTQFHLNICAVIMNFVEKSFQRHEFALLWGDNHSICVKASDFSGWGCQPNAIHLTWVFLRN